MFTQLKYPLLLGASQATFHRSGGGAGGPQVFMGSLPVSNDLNGMTQVSCFTFGTPPFFS